MSLLTALMGLTRWLYTLVAPTPSASHLTAMVTTVALVVMVVAIILLSIDRIPIEVSSLAIIVLQLMTSVSVVVYFGRNGSSLSRWRTVVAPVIGAIGLGAAVGFYISANGNRDAAVDARTLEDSRRFNDRADGQRAVSIVAGLAGAGLVSYAIVRWLKKPETSAPTVTIVPGSATFGYVARF